MLAVLNCSFCAPRARAPECAAARASQQRGCSSALSAPHRSRVGAPAAAHRAPATHHRLLRRAGAAIRPADAAKRVGGRFSRIARRAVDSDGAGGALSSDGGATTDDADAPAAWLADDDDAEVCAASFEVTEAALRSLCHGNAPPPACTHEYCA